MTENAKNGRSVLLFGATGLIGRNVLAELVCDSTVDKITVFSRRAPETDSREKIVHHKINFDRLEDSRELIQGDQIFICLGTTRSAAGSKEAAYNVDYHYVVNAAKLASENSVEDAFVISSLGANARSSVFYSRTKGEMESAIAKLPFRSVSFLRPSLLVGSRERQRVGEVLVGHVGLTFGFLFAGPLRKYRPIRATDVAHAMVHHAKSTSPGKHFLESNQLQPT